MSSNDIAIKAERLGKEYRLGERERYGALRDVLMDWLRRAPKALGRRNRRQEQKFWALKDVSFEIPHGQAVGIIGRNGAGKSTLLKVLSRITEPTEGQAIVSGRVGSLLEVGTGFHPEMTGRENVFLSGAILGMSQAEVRRKFDEIIAFAELEKFVDTPVKRYSSGMYVRLAFAVAAHLEPEILLVDEVLAVGDLRFQKKCLAKMHDAGHSGRTILFVSHNMAAVTRLCSRGLLLEQGQVVADGNVGDVVSKYLTSSLGASAVREWPDPRTRPGRDGFKVLRVEVATSDGPTNLARVSDELTISITFCTQEPGMHFRIVAILQTQGVVAFATLQPREERYESPGRYCSRVVVPAHLLAEGEYTVDLSVIASRGSKAHLCRVEDAVAFQIFDPMQGDSARGDYAEGLAGVLRPKLPWRTERVEGECAESVD